MKISNKLSFIQTGPIKFFFILFVIYFFKIGKCFCEIENNESNLNQFDFLYENEKKKSPGKQNNFQSVLESLQSWIKPKENFVEEKYSNFRFKSEKLNTTYFSENINNLSNNSDNLLKNNSNNSLDTVFDKIHDHLKNDINFKNQEDNKKEITENIDKNQIKTLDKTADKTVYYFDNSFANITIKNFSKASNSSFEDVDIVRKISEYGQEDLATIGNNLLFKIEKYPFKPNVEIFSEYPYQPPEIYEEKIPESLTQIRLKSDWEPDQLVVYKDYEKKNLETPMFYTKQKNQEQIKLEEDFQENENEIRKTINNVDGNYFYLPMGSNTKKDKSDVQYTKTNEMLENYGQFIPKFKQISTNKAKNDIQTNEMLENYDQFVPKFKQISTYSKENQLKTISDKLDADLSELDKEDKLEYNYTQKDFENQKLSKDSNEKYQNSLLENVFDNLQKDLNDVNLNINPNKSFLNKYEKKNEVSGEKMYEKLNGIENLLKELILIERDKRNKN